MTHHVQGMHHKKQNNKCWVLTVLEKWTFRMYLWAYLLPCILAFPFGYIWYYWVRNMMLTHITCMVVQWISSWLQENYFVIGGSKTKMRTWTGLVRVAFVLAEPEAGNHTLRTRYSVDTEITRNKTISRWIQHWRYTLRTECRNSFGIYENTLNNSVVWPSNR